MDSSGFNYVDERFADVQMLRYRLNGFDALSPRQKLLVYYLSEATLCGRDITFDQYGCYNLCIRRVLEAIYIYNKGVADQGAEASALAEYLKRIWFSNGIYHHYGCEKFVPGFSPGYLLQMMKRVEKDLPLRPNQTAEQLYSELRPVIFDAQVLPKRVNKADGDDLVLTSACHFYEGVTQTEVEEYYQRLKQQAANDPQPPSFGLNTTLLKRNGTLHEQPWKVGGRYGEAISRIVEWLEKAAGVAENEQQRQYIRTLVDFYRTGDLRRFNDYCIQWVQENAASVDFINGFIEVYGDPLGLKGTWEGIVEYTDEQATRRTRLISSNAQWFEDHSPVAPQFRKPQVKGISAKAICAAMLGGEEYPSTAIGINLPNADWIRAEHGSKSITISNITEAYDMASRSNGFLEAFADSAETVAMIRRYGEVCDVLHTDLHECLGHGSGRLLPGVDPDALKAYGNTIEEARADLFGLYYIADPKLVELGLTPDGDAYKSQYYTYILNGMLTQLARIKPGQQIEEAHMRNRALVARWCYEQGRAENVISMEISGGNTYIHINDYAALRTLFARLLAEIQRIKSEGDYEAARTLVEQYAVKVDPQLHEEVLRRYQKLNIAPYKGFINPVLSPVVDEQGAIIDVRVDYNEHYDEQMLRYSSQYGFLPNTVCRPEPDTRERLKAVKQSFRRYMNGEASRSMREKGLGYRLNWGVSVADLRSMAARIGKDYDLAIALFKEDIRECKILATMVMPAERMLPELVEVWMEQTTSQEIAEMAAFNLYQHLDFAPVLAYEWMASSDELRQICGYHVLARLFMKGQEPNERGINEFLDQALTALSDPSLGVRHAAMTCLRRFADMGDDYRKIAEKAAKSAHLELF